MRVLLIGGGAISSDICKPEEKFVHAVVRVVSLRDFDLMDRSKKSELLDSDYDRIFYLGYYRSDLSKNLSLSIGLFAIRLSKLLHKLSS